jgi:DNA-binding LytR/AlgR family response regulator
MKYAKQLLFWIVIAIVLVLIFGGPYGSFVNAFYFVVFLLPIIIGTSYVFNSFLIPRYLLEKRYFKFSLYTFYTIIISLNLEMLVITLAFAVLANYQYASMLPATNNVYTLGVIMYFIVIVRSFILILKQNFQNTEKVNTLLLKQEELDRGYILIKSNRQNHQVRLEDISHIESLGDYVKIHLVNKPLLITKEKISKLESRLPKPFIRIHRSIIVNANHVKQFTSESVQTSSGELPISRSYKKATLDYLKK